MLTAKERAGGCWTCRLRRKKCDKIRPECGVCKSLEVNCHFNPRKPEWMVRGDKQREMADKIKHQIKRNAASRRERRQASAGSAVNSKNGRGTFVIDFDSHIVGSASGSRSIGSVELSDYKSVSPTGQDLSVASSHTLDVQSSDGIHDNNKHRTPSGSSSPHPRTVLDILHHSMGDHICSAFFSQNSDYEVDFIMKYLDYVFPSLFPFYQPAIFETGRSWLLSLLRNSKIAFHSALSLTSYFFTIALTDAYGDTYADCTSELWGRLENQNHKCFEIIHTNMLDLNFRDKTVTVLEKVHVMESIIQILMFEVVLGKPADWNLHLTPAIALFEEVMGGADPHGSKMISVLHNISPPTWYKVEYDHYMWNPDQAGFRFFATLLIFIDIIASTALAQPPKLTPYHSELLSSQDDGAPILGFTHLRLSTLVGCQNSVIVAIGQIATLDAWKQSMKRAEGLSIPELVERSTPISTSLNSTLDALESDASLRRPQHLPNLPFQSYAVRSCASGSSATTTRIWAHAAQVYLAVVVSGWQPSNPEVRGGVSLILELLRTVPSNHLRTLAWPLCVAGCLASVDQEQGFRDVFSGKKNVELIGSPNEARRVMEAVWKKRQRVNTETWDLAVCFSILEKPVLLV